jgi:hypothetical protein
MAARLAVFTVAALLCMAVAAQAEPQIGVAAAVKNSVQGILGANTRALSVGSGVFSNERIRTGDDATAQLLLLDKTTLTVGPKAELLLDRFAYNPNRGAGEVVLDTVRGSFQFVTGSQDPRKYTIKTPSATLGIRGTILKWYIVDGQLGVFLISGGIDITLPGGQIIHLDQPGTGYVISKNGVQGPLAYDTTLMNFVGDVTTDNPNFSFSNIDQLHGLIQQPQECDCYSNYRAHGAR